MGLLELALSSRHLTAELIADGVHAPLELTTIAYRCFGKDRLCLISDASAGTGMPCGTHFDMGSACGVVADGVAVTQDGAAFCGSTSFLLDVLRFCATSAEIPLADCSAMASGTPARVAGIDHARGQLKPRLFADLIVLDERLALTGVMTEGRWLAGVGVS
jgi:N-acetylglucosamine-6-phosphate deacetylase